MSGSQAQTVCPVSGGPASDALARIEGWLEAECARSVDVHDGDRLVAVRQADAAAECSYRYDARGDLVEIVEPDGRCARYVYDAQRRLVAVHGFDGLTDRYRYDDDDRLISVDRHGRMEHFGYDAAGRLVQIARGNAGAAVYRYDETGRAVEDRTAIVVNRRSFDDAGRVSALAQIVDGIEIGLALAYDRAGRLAEMTISGLDQPIRYRWDERGRPAAVALGVQTLARFRYADSRRETLIALGNGIVETSQADPVDARPLSRTWQREGMTLAACHYRYDREGRIVADGISTYRYDARGRLESATAGADGRHSVCFAYQDDDPRPRRSGGQPAIRRDVAGALTHKRTAEVTWSYRYDEADQLTEVRRNGDVVARLTYDAKGRLAVLRTREDGERYLYGPSDELIAVTDLAGRVLRVYVRTPIARVALVRLSAGTPVITYLHHDERGTVHLASDACGAVTDRLRFDSFGLPQADHDAPIVFRDREWIPAIGLYRFGARWYDPEVGEFLTADAYSAAPDDIRIIHPLRPGREQAAARDALLATWLKRPHLRDRFAFCGNDPVNAVDPNGHWSFGGVLLSILGALWTLPNTVFGLLVEITCLIGEVIRWLVYLVTGGNVSWATPGFDAAASGRLNAFALVFSGGWLGSFSSLLGITFGNVFFVYKDWRTEPALAGGGTVSPSAYGGTETFPISEALYEHELRHTNQYGWFGPFFHLGLPLFGVYEWDVILHGYRDSWLERDAREHGGI